MSYATYDATEAIERALENTDREAGEHTIEGVPYPLRPKKEARTEWGMDRVHTIDIETAEWTEVVSLGHLTPDGEYREFNLGNSLDPISDFVDEMLRAEWRNHRFVAHNGSGFDFGFIIEELLSREEVSFHALTNGQDKPFNITVRDRHGKPRYLQDSLMLLPRTLNSLAEAFAPDMANIEEVAYDEIRPEWEEMEPKFRYELSEYLENDCRILRAVLEEFTEIIEDLSEGTCGPQLTIGSTTLAMYQTNFMHREPVPQFDPSFRNLSTDGNPEDKVREAYAGGRTEVFRMRAPPEEGPFYHYDVNSLFPYVYTEFDLPAGSPTYLSTVSEDHSDDLLRGSMFEDHDGAVKIEGHVPEDCKYPVLPVRVEQDYEKTLFPTGHVDGWFMLREVRYALSVGALENCRITEAVIAKNHDVFREYGETLYELKNSIDSSSNPGLYNTVKLLLNSFYGKFAMGRRQTSVRRVTSREELSDPDTRYVAVGGHRSAEYLQSLGIVGEEEYAESPYIVPRISAAITAQARIEMHKWFMLIEEDLDGRIFYCDTDSIVTDTPLPEEYVSDDLGAMDLEGTLSEAYFLRPKTYAEQHTDGSTTLKGKGMRDLAERVELSDGTVSEPVEFEDYRDALEKQDPTRIRVKWEGPRGLMASLKDTEEEKVLSVDQFSRGLKGFDDKRDHSVDGLDSEPLNLDEIHREQARAEWRKEQAKEQRELAQTALSSMVGDHHEIDSTLTAGENKSNLYEQRKEQARDRDMF